MSLASRRVSRHSVLMLCKRWSSYWGQNAGGNGQQDIGAYCQDDTIDNIIIAFLDSFGTEDGEIQLNLANVSFFSPLPALLRLLATCLVISWRSVADDCTCDRPAATAAMPPVDPRRDKCKVVRSCRRKSRSVRTKEK